jgi:hypothetical protein
MPLPASEGTAATKKPAKTVADTNLAEYRIFPLVPRMVLAMVIGDMISDKYEC